jgi:hypothetical protein
MYVLYAGTRDRIKMSRKGKSHSSTCGRKKILTACRPTKVQTYQGFQTSQLRRPFEIWVCVSSWGCMFLRVRVEQRHWRITLADVVIISIINSHPNMGVAIHDLNSAALDAVVDSATEPLIAGSTVCCDGGVHSRQTGLHKLLRRVFQNTPVPNLPDTGALMHSAGSHFTVIKLCYITAHSWTT